MLGILTPAPIQGVGSGREKMGRPCRQVEAGYVDAGLVGFAGFDGIQGTHLHEMESEERRRLSACHGLHPFENPSGLRKSPLLQVRILEPPERMVSARLDRLLVRRCFPGGFVRPCSVVPHTHCEKNVRRHVLGVGSRRRDFRVDAGCPKAQRRVNRIVVGMDRIVQRSGVLADSSPERPPPSPPLSCTSESPVRGGRFRSARGHRKPPLPDRRDNSHAAGASRRRTRSPGLPSCRPHRESRRRPGTPSLARSAPSRAAASTPRGRRQGPVRTRQARYTSSLRPNRPSQRPGPLF